ncbi:DUF309 domain-containing protein [Nocardia camponoti]|uniref:DUF309 domain-containing protein n=1 Tax=Nocardia camponoti TaxID=1616106 RepID=A0A917VEN7_9NOCA|nr:DUF309 domain-containing protein [Nocardia camponoti]GGK69662.1 hypothetical protein GCM10011591_47250 [Nocardia camponoti]
MISRDRDAAGRARNDRPRDRLGRPLPPGSVGVARIPDDLELPPQQTLDFAQQLLDEGLAFNAHEVLEAAWKNGPVAERMLWQGLAQYAVGLTHIQRGNAKGAATLLRRAAQRLGEYPANSEHYAVDTAGLIAHTESLLSALDSSGPIADDQLRTSLRVRGS